MLQIQTAISRYEPGLQAFAHTLPLLDGIDDVFYIPDPKMRKLGAVTADWEIKIEDRRGLAS